MCIIYCYILWSFLTFIFVQGYSLFCPVLTLIRRWIWGQCHLMSHLRRYWQFYLGCMICFVWRVVYSDSAVSFDNNQVSTLAFRFWPKTVWLLQWMQLFTSASVTQPCQSLMWKRLISQLVCLHRQHCEISLAPKISVKFWQTVKRSAMLCRYRHNFGIINLCLLEISGLGFICLLHFVDFSWYCHRSLGCKSGTCWSVSTLICNSCTLKFPSIELWVRSIDCYLEEYWITIQVGRKSATLHLGAMGVNFVYRFKTGYTSYYMWTG